MSAPAAPAPATPAPPIPRGRIDALLASPAATLLARPWFDWVALHLGIRIYMPLSRAWAAALDAEGSTERFRLEIGCDLPRPRDRQSAAFDFVKRRVLAALDRSLDRAIITDDGETKAAAGGGLWW